MAVTFDTRSAASAGSADTVEDAIAARRDRAFALARRHSRLVRVLRVLLPLAACGMMIAYALVLLVSWQLGAGRIRVGNIQITAEDLKMKDPTYFGITKEGGRYQVRAKRAEVSLNQNEPIKLFDISGELTDANKVVTKLKSKHGLFNNAKGELELFDGIEIDGSNGLVARLSRAMIYQKDNRIVSKDPVTASTPTGSVQASALSMNNKTRMVEFRGAVAVRLLPGAQGPVAIGRDARQPVDIYSEELDVDDAQKTAHFRGSVVATQGETTLKTPYLFVKYEGKAASGLAPEPSQGEQSSSRVTFLWARNGVDITSGIDRRITSDLADFDAKADTALFVGNVQVTQEKNWLKGERLFVDRKASKSHMESPGEGNNPAGRIMATFYQAEGKTGPQPKASATDQAQESMFGSFKSDPNAPIEIEADTLDVLDASKKAVFTGNVWAKQGDMVIRTVELTAFYAGQSGFGLNTGATPAPKGETAQIVRVEARRKVLITSKDGQNATSDWANFDVKSNTALLGGGVLVMRGKDIAEGPRLKIDLTTGMYRFELDADAKQPSVSSTASPNGPASHSGPAAAPNLENRTCPPGKQCMLFYPKDAKEKAPEFLRKAP